jgi:hypothetical protein
MKIPDIDEGRVVLLAGFTANRSLNSGPISNVRADNAEAKLGLFARAGPDLRDRRWVVLLLQEQVSRHG